MDEIIPKIENMNNDDTYINKAIIKPPETDFKNLPTRKIRYIVDSRDRNYNLFPSPSKYVINTEEVIRDIVKVDLVLSDFKFNDYNVTKYNNILHIDSNTYTIPEGKYDAQELCDKLNEVTSIEVIYNHITDKFTFKGDGNILKFKSDFQERYDDTMVDVYEKNSIGKTLGFPIDNYELNIDGIEAPYRVNLNSENYIVMYMAPTKVYQSKNNKVLNAFAIINKEESNGFFINGNETLASKSFNPRLPTFDRLSFKFCDRNGNLYDFQNKEHRMVLVFTCLRQTVSYNGIFN